MLMRRPDYPLNEVQRREALERLGILSFRWLSSLDYFAKLAADFCGTPMAFVNFIDRDQQWTKGAFGTAGGHRIPRALAFCSHTINQEEVFEVEDAAIHPDFIGHPLVVGNPKVRFYAGVALRTKEGLAVGALCVVDTVPRKLTTAQKITLELMAQQILKILMFNQ